MEKGKFIVAYGVNNIGKTTQVKSLVEHLNRNEIPSQYLKYAIYELEPTGPRINAYLRKHNPEGLTPLQFQELQVQNRWDYEPALRATLEKGIWVVVEDYVGTGIAWGMAAGVPRETLEALNRGLLVPDLEFLLDGERFGSREVNHAHEGDQEMWQKGRAAHQILAPIYHWPVIDSHRSEGEVFCDILELVQDRIPLNVEGGWRCGKER